MNLATLRKRNKKKLADRRQRLSTLLTQERELYEDELRGVKGTQSDQFREMKDRVDTLRSRREEERKKLAQAKFQQHFDENCRELRQLESRQMQRDTEATWEAQQLERQSRLRKDEEERRRYEEEQERQRQWQEAEHAARERSRQSERRAVAEELQAQMRQLKLKDQEAARLKQEQHELLMERKAIIEAEDERQKLEEQHKQAEYGRQLTRQYKAQLRRKSRLVQEELELDMQILNRMLEEEKYVAQVETSRREKARTDAAWMKEVVAEQLALEKQREEEMDLLYREEAEREWRKHELQWQKEREARQRLMKQVFEERQSQLSEKLESVQRQQAESVEERERLLEDIAIAEQMTARESKHEAAMRRQRERELDEQMREAQSRAELEREMEELDLQEDRLAEEEYSHRVHDRLTARTAQPYAPKSFGRRKVAWQ
eukprot:scpid9485/ scgid10579/ Trichoplein keratin filament-binding protein